MYTDVAAVEVMNVLRPVVAVARFVNFAASAQHEKSECHQKLQAANNGYLEPFVQSNIAGHRGRWTRNGYNPSVPDNPTFKE